MHAGAGGVEVAAHEGIVVGDVVVQFLFEELGHFAQDGGIGGGIVTGERDVFDDQGLQRRVARALAKAEQRAVDRAAAVEPGRDTVDQHLVEIVVAVPFQPFAGHTGLIGEGAHDALHRAGQGRAGIGHAVAHGVAQADLDRHAALLAQLHELLGEGQAEAVDVGTGDVLEMAARDDAPFQGLPGQVQIHVHGLLAGLPQLEIDVVVRHAGQHAGLVELHVPGQLEVFLVGADPGGHAREAVAARPADIDALAVLGRVQEKLRRRDEARFAAHAVQEIEHLGHLLDRIRRPGMLAVTEGGVRDAHLFGGTRGKEHLVEGRAADAGVGKKLAVQLGLFPFLKRKRANAARLVDDAAHDTPSGLKSDIQGKEHILLARARQRAHGRRSGPGRHHVPAAGTCQNRQNGGLYRLSEPSSG